jgi:hypothetical protein
MAGTRVTGLSAVLGLLAYAQPALADPSTLPSPTYTPGSPFTGTIKVTASVGGACGFASAPSASYTVNDIDTTAWSRQKDFNLDCNVASRVAVISSSGGLKNPTVPGTPGYTNLAPYTVDLFLQGSTTTSSGSCTAASLKDGTCTAFYGTAVTGQTTGLRLASSSVNIPGSYIKLSAPAYGFAGPNLLINGSYSDTLTISVAAAP